MHWYVGKKLNFIILSGHIVLPNTKFQRRPTFTTRYSILVSDTNERSKSWSRVTNPQECKDRSILTDIVCKRFHVPFGPVPYSRATWQVATGDARCNRNIRFPRERESKIWREANVASVTIDSAWLKKKKKFLIHKKRNKKKKYQFINKKTNNN